MKHKTTNIFLYIAIALLSISSALAQENCTNGVDDDGDGFIDCYDGDCAGGPSCADFFYGNPIVCKDEPTENPTFLMKLQWGSEDRSADSHATPAVGDLDNDGLPEVVVINRLDEKLFILNGEDGTTAFTYDLGYQPENGIVLANLDGGDCANIYISRDNSSTITALDCEANFLWQTNASDRVGIMGIADFNGDGNPELYYKTEIMDAATGNIIVPGTADNWVQKYAHSAIAVDILDDSFCADCSGLELITGNQIWAINIAAGTRTLAKDLNNLFAAEIPVNNKRYYTKYFNTNQNRTSISVADYNLDGHVDVLMPGAYGSSNSSQTTIFFWDVFNNTYKVYTGGVNHSKGTGRLNVADIDGDGQMNTTYVSDQILYALDENLNVLWTKGIDEGSSGFTGTTVFDFDGDGAAETIYRSESYLYIIDGTDGSTRTTVACKSRTQEEYPLVADVDNDGSSELCVPCYTSNSTPFSPYNNTRFSQIRIYEADGGEIWQPSRRVWNQHGYYNVNVNDDLTIPAQQQDHTAIFGTVNCDTGLPEDNRALNGFLNQSTFLEADGCPSYVSPDLNMAGNVVATPSLCPLTTFDVSFDIENTGDTDIFGTLPVTFYNGDPETPGAIKLNTETVVINNFLQGEIRTINMTVEGSGGDFDLYISINNNGQAPPITPGSGGFPECDFSNNIANVPVTYTPFTLTVNKLEENRRCDPSKPNNGEAEAYFEGTLGGGYETFWVEDFTGLPNGDRSDAGSTAWTSTKGSFNPIYWGVNTKSGNKVYRTRKTGQNNEVSEVTWLSEVIDISNHTDIDISLDMLTNNTLEASGGGRDYMRAFYIVDGGAETEFDVNGELYGSFLYAVAEQEDLNGSTLQIKVTFHTTGNGEYQFLDNVQVSGTTAPVVQQFTDADGFEFDWYNAGDFSAPVANGSLYTGMPTGSYDVVGYFPGGNCYSDTVNIVINDSVPTFNVHVYEVAPYTDCADPDGALSAFVYTQTDVGGDPLDTLTAGYSFSWVLSTEGITPVGTGPDLTNISSESYTVRVEQLITGCTSSASGAPSSSLIIPADPTPVPVDIIACSGPGSTGSATVSVGGITAGYTFEWFYESVDATADYTGSSISSLLEGTYYVKAIDNGSSCESGLVTMQIQDLSGEPTPSTTSVDNTSCTAFTGQVSADGDGAGTTAGYNFTWYAGKNDDPNNELPAAIPGATASADGSTISNLPGGYYTVVVEQGGCVGSDTVFVDENFVIPQFTFNTPIDTEESIVLDNNGYVELPQLFGPGNEITNAVTISYWANLSVDNYNNDERIFSSGSTGENQVLLWSDNHNGLAFVVRTSSGGRGRINSGYSATGWAQIVGTWDGTTGEMKMYVNGVLIGTDNHIGSGILIDTGNPMYLGRDGNIGSKKFEGELDEVRIYNKALTIQEINDQLCTELTGTEDGLVAYYNFNNIASPNTGTVVPDLAPQDGSNDAVIRNGGAANISYPTATITCPNGGFNNNRSCDAGSPNGEVDLSDKIIPAPGGGITYDFEIYNGFSTAGAPLDANTSGLFTGLPGGFYTVIATDQATGCVTLEGRVSLNDIPDNPSIITSITDDTSCDTFGSGEIAVTSSSSSTEPGGGYTYEIFDGFNFTTEIGSDVVVPDGSVGHTYTGLTDGPYRIRVTNNTLTCTSYVDVNVGDNPTNPSWNHPSTIVNDNTTCVGTPNGFVSVAVAGGNTNFSFEWYNGAIVDPGQLIAAETDEFIDELAGGQQYTVVATSTITGCSTPAKTVTVNNTPIYPNVVIVEVQPQYSCDVGDGILRAYVDEPDPSDCVECNEADDYSFQWFLGNDTSTPLIEATDPGNNSNPTYVDSSRVEGLTGAYDYTVQVTNNLTGCTNEATFSLTYDPQSPVIDAANSKVTANTLCGPSGNGSVVAAVNFVGETINGAINDQTWDVITDCNTVTDLNSSILPDGSIQLTPDVNNQAGKAYLGDSVDFSKPTRIDFWMYLGNKDVGADGITFIFHQDPDGKDALGRYGCNLGIGDENCFGGTETAIAPSVAVEFDTYNNGGATKDPAWDHTAFVINGEMDKPQGDVGVFYNANQPRIVNGQNDVEGPDTELRVTITIVPNFDGTQTFSVYVEDELRLQRTQDFINDLFGGNPKTIGGFTASTGGQRNQQYVRLDPYFGEYDFDWYTGTGVNPANEILGADRPFLCDLLGGDYTLVVTYAGSGCTSSPPVTFTIPNNTDTATVSFSGVSNTVCDTTLAIGGNFTGSLTANIAENPVDYVFAWFEGTAPTADTLATTQSITNIPGGDYTVVVESLAGGCISIKDTTLVDVTVDPAIIDVNADVTVNNVTSCEGSATYPNGSITVNTVGIGTGPFGFWYYYGADTTTGTFLTDASDIFTQTGAPGTSTVNVSGNGTATLSNLSAGDYTIIVVDSASGCTSIEANVNIIDVPTIPNLDQNVTPNTVCDPALAASGVYDGEVEVITTDGTDAVADYTYLWYDGTGTGTPTTYTVTNNILSEAPNGNYTVVATNTTTGCDTTIYATIGDATVVPTIDNLTTQNVTACEGGPAYPNGSITIAAVTGTGPFDYLYYAGTDATTGTLLTDGSDIFTQTGAPGVASVNVSGTGTTTITGLSAGDYTIVLVDQATGCTSIESNVSLSNIPTIPELDQNVTANTICDPLLAASGNYDGEVEIITTDATNVTDYSYVWYDGTGTGTPTTYTATNNILSEAPDGNYTVVATSNITGCDTTIYATIGDATTIPTIDNVTTQNVTACEGGPAYPNGSITVAAVTGTGPFNYLYYYGTDATTGTFLSDGVDIFTQTGTPGAASVNVNGNGTATITGLSAGDYTIVLVDQATGCSSIEANVQLVDVPTIPALDQNITDNTVCDNTINNSGDFDGEVEIITTDATNVTDYTYVWYDGTGTATPTVYTATNNILSEAPDGNYTVVATSNITGCDTTIFATIGDATVDPVLGTFNITDMTVCDGAAVYPNGAIEVDEPSITGSGDYSYEFYWGPSVDAAKLLSDGDNITFEKTGFVSGQNVSIAGNIISNLDTGFYTIVAIDNVSGCISGEQTVEIEDVFIAINVPAPVINHYTNCDAPDGSITVAPAMASGPEPALGYSYQWYFGSGTGNTLDAADLVDPSALAGTTSAAVSGLEDGTYTVVITNNDTGCDTEEEYDIQDQRVYPVVDPGLIATSPNINCSGPPTGSIDPTGAVSEPGPYVFTLYDAADAVITTEDTGGGDDGIFDGLAAANYKIGVELASGCVSVATASVTVSDNFTYPNLTVTKLSNETSCIAPNGQIRVNDPGTAPAAGFDIIVYSGIGTGGAVQETIGDDYTGAFPISGTANMATGTYTVQMLNNDTGCESLVQVTINNVPDRPALVGGNVTKTDDTNCTSDNGSITISTVTNPGVDPIFNLYSGSSIVPANLITSAQHPATNHTFSGLAAGTYTVSVIKDESGCESNGITRTVNFTPVSFTPGVSVFSDQSSCLITDPNGELIASIAIQGTGPSTSVGDYNFEWYQGQNTNPANRITTGGIIPTAVVSSTNDSRVAGLPAGTYRLKVIEPVSGCFYVIDETIDLITTTPVIPGGGILITDADQCAPSNGEINITVNDGGSTQTYDGAGGYTFELYVGTIGAGEMPIQTFNQTAVFGAPNYQATHTFTDLQPDDYTIRIIDNNTSCLVTSTLQTVGFVGTSLAFDPNNMANIPLTGCFGNDGTLDIGTSLTIPTNTDDVDITWYVGSDTSNTADQIVNRIPSAVFSNIINYNTDGYDIINGNVTNLPAVSYTGVAELSNGCKFLLEVDLSIIDAPDLLTAVTTPVSRCSPTYDGEVTLTVTPNNGNNAGQYNYYLYPGTYTVTDVTPGAPWDPAANTYNGGVTAGNDGSGDGTGTFTNNGADTPDAITISELDSGTYTVIIEINTGSGCVTNVETVTIDPPTEPSVTFDSKSDNTVCDVTGALDYNGSITVDAEHPDFAGSTFTFEWYYDNDGDGDFTAGQTVVANGADGAGVGSFVTGAVTNDALTATLTGVGPGWYRVIATHTDANNAGVNATACPDTLDIEIFDDFVELVILPAAITTQTNVLDCSGGPEEFGEFLLATVREDGADLAATTVGGNFTITWEYDNGGGFAPYAPNVDQNHSDDLVDGDYRITAVSTTTGCEVSYDFTIEDVTEDPVINMLNLADNSICVGGPIGTIEADGQIIIEIQDELGAVQDPVDYDVEWFLNSIAGGNEIPATQVTGADITTTAVDVTIDDLPGGTYWVRVTKNNGDDEQCETTASFVLIDDPAEVTIQKILNTDYTTAHNTDCAPDENGRVTLLNVYEDGVADPVVNGNYVFNWYDADQVTPISVGTVNVMGDDVTDLPAGTYYVEAENINTDCVSDKVPFTINDNRVIPNLQLAQTLPDTTCVGSLVPSGEVTASVILPGGGTGNPADYTFTWYEGVGTGTPITVGAVDGAAVNGEMYEQLPAGIYTVEVEDNVTPGDNCTATAQITVSRFSPVISIQTVDITIQNDLECNIDNGSATVDRVTVTKYGGGTYKVNSGDAAFADFDFNWYFTASGGVSQDNDNVFDMRPAGTYYVSVSNTQTLCAMPAGGRKAVTIQDVTTLPNVQLVTKTPDEYCTTVANEGDGTLEIEIIHEGNNPANPADYTITWYRGTGTGTTLAVAPGSSAIAGGGTQLSGLSTGTYTVVVAKNASPNDGCSTQKTFTIVRDVPTYSLPESAMTIQDNQNCLNPNGTITINGIHIDGVFEDFALTGDNYTIVWTGLPGTATLNTVNFANDEVTDLEAGLYEVDITNDRTNCTVNATIELDDIGTNPVVQLVTKNPDEYCSAVVPNEGDGDLTIKVVHEGNNPANPLDYVITWYRGTGTATTLASAMGTASVSADGTTLTGLSAGTYTATVTKSGTPNDGCFVQQTFTINRDPQTYSLPAAAITKTNNLNCTNPNGTITIDGVFIDGVFDDFATTADTYTLNWTGLPGGATLNTVEFADDQVTTIPGGTYTVDVTNERTNCTVTANITITDVTSNPLIQLVTKTPDEYCATVTPNEGDGSLNIKLVHEGNNPADSTLYNIQWYRGTGTGTLLTGALGSAVISPNGTGLSGLSAGTYTVTVTDANSPNLGCFTTQTFTINRDAPTYSLPLSAMTIQDNLNCDNPNGSITIDGVRIDGVFEDFGTTTDTYTINWTGLPGTAVLGTVNFADDQVTGIEGGTYTVDVTNDRTGCTVSADVVLDDITSNPLVQLVIKQPDEYCDNTGFQGNGSLEMKIVHEGNNPANQADYVITWYRGTGTGTTLASTPGSSSVVAGGTQLTGLSTGTYTVVVTKNGAPNDQCLTTTTFSITKDIPPFTIQKSSVAIADNTNCTTPNGSIQITNVVLDGVVQDLATFGADYAFTWPDGYNGGTPGSINSPNDIATGLPAGDYKIIGENVVTGCSTDTIIVTIIDDQVDPLLSFNVDQVNTNCGPTKNGQLTVTATTADGNPSAGVGRYTFTWYDGEGIATPTSYVQSDGVGANDNQSTLLALDSGYYTVEVFDNINECTTVGTYAVSETLVNPKIFLSDIVVRADSTCDVGSSGTIIVADSSFSVGVLDDYDVQIRSLTPGGTIVAQSIAGSGNTDLTISSLDPGVFYVTATRASTECVAAPVKINILDERFLPELTLDSLIANVNCGGGAANGQLMINADGFDHTNPAYTFQWYIGQVVGVVVPAGNGGTTANPFGLAEGYYTVEVTNTNTGCVRTQVFELPSIQILPTFTSYEVNNNTACVDNGSIVLLEGQYGSTLIDSMALATDYTVGWFSDAGLTTPIVDPVPATPLELEQLGNGTYYVTLTNDTTNCTSEPLELVIIDNILYPSLNGIQLAADSTCNMTGTPTGALRVIADNQNNPGSNYTFTWYAASDLVTPIGNNDTLSAQFAGDYVVEVTNTSIGCTSTETFTIQSRPVNIVINDVTTTAPTSCMPPNGIIEVTDISYGVLSDYTFEFRDESNNIMQSGPDSIYNTADAGKYLIYATHNTLQCTNPLVYSVIVDDGNLVYPDIDLVSFENQTNCDPGNPNGEISASADGSTDNVAYNFEWRDDANNIVEPNNATVTNIPAGTYTLNVTDNTTGCMSSTSFDIVDDYPDPLQLVISTSPNTNCVDPNGEVSATIRNLASIGKPITDYIFYWFNGDQTSGVPDVANPDYLGTLVSNLPDGDYTVYVVDATDAFCTSDPTLVTIQDRTLPPPFEVEIQNHVTICYDSLPDGRARVNPASLETNRELFEFRYEWYLGTAADTAGQAPFVTGIRADSLDIGTYSVLSIDLRTGCENLVTFDIIDDTDAVPAPDVNVISDRDNCAFANGHAIASISGAITGYRFEWFLASGDTTTVQFTGHEVFTLDSVDYKVRATRISTGCISPRTPVEVINAIQDPVFEIATTTSLCLRTEDGAFNQFTGTAELIFSDFGVIKQIDWIAPDGTVFSNDIKLVNAQPGRWDVRFVLDNDCEYFGTFGIETALKIYNGVSANADGLNDYFFIDCIDYFPNNNVQIFNRDGTKVWESDAYNNNDIRFDGFSNVGRGGLQLPAGTYFYIIEKGPQEWGTDDELEDNTIRPRIQGYLELVR